MVPRSFFGAFFLHQQIECSIKMNDLPAYLQQHNFFIENLAK